MSFSYGRVYYEEKIKDLNLEDKIHIESRAISYEELGNDIYPPVKRVLEEKNVPYTLHHSTPLKSTDYNDFDYFIGMDHNNVLRMKGLFGKDPDHKIYRLLDFANLNKNIEDPWYTRNYTRVYEEITTGCESLLERIVQNKKIDIYKKSDTIINV